MIGARVKRVREAEGLTQAAFACRLGVERSLISKIEGGRTALSSLLLRTLCDRFAVREDWLLHGRGELWEDRWVLLERRARELGLDVFIPRGKRQRSKGLMVAEAIPPYGLSREEREWWLALWPEMKAHPDRLRLLNELLALWGLPRYKEKK